MMRAIIYWIILPRPVGTDDQLIRDNSKLMPIVQPTIVFNDILISRKERYWLKSVLILAAKLTNPPAGAEGWLRGCGPRSNKHCGAEQQKVSVHTFTHSHFAHRLSEINTWKDHKNWKQLLSLRANETCVPFFFFYFYEPFSKVTNAICLCTPKCWNAFQHTKHISRCLYEYAGLLEYLHIHPWRE